MLSIGRLYFLSEGKVERFLPTYVKIITDEYYSWPLRHSTMLSLSFVAGFLFQF
jgi:hypothetical protein